VIAFLPLINTRALSGGTVRIDYLNCSVSYSGVKGFEDSSDEFMWMEAIATVLAVAQENIQHRCLWIV